MDLVSILVRCESHAASIASGDCVLIWSCITARFTGYTGLTTTYLSDRTSVNFSTFHLPSAIPSYQTWAHWRDLTHLQMHLACACVSYLQVAQHSTTDRGYDTLVHHVRLCVLSSIWHMLTSLIESTHHHVCTSDASRNVMWCLLILCLDQACFHSLAYQPSVRHKASLENDMCTCILVGTTPPPSVC